MARKLPAVPLLGALLLASCVVIVQRGRVETINPDRPEVSVVTVPMKAFLQNGEMVLFERGADVTREEILGPGLRYSLNRSVSVPVSAVPLDSVVGIEAFEGKVDVPASFVLSAFGTGVAMVGAAALAVAIFGSCPTFYASPEAGSALLAEAFSYSVAAPLERRDLDLLSIRPDSDGVLRLEVRNEALETHYINNLALLEVEHSPEVQIVPDAGTGLLGFRDPAPPLTARDRDGRDVLGEVLATDGLSFSTTEVRIASATCEDSRDYLELTFDSPPVEDAVLVLNLRNSLLNTVLFYDLMLSTAGVRAINWWGGSREGILSGIDLAHWYVDNLGLQVETWEPTGWVTQAKVLGIGPIAWKVLGVEIPVPSAGPIRIRLSFMADDWRIEKASLASRNPIEHTREVPVHTVISSSNRPNGTAAENLSQADEEYFVTYPGTSSILEFLPGTPAPGKRLTYLLSTQGYYIEWMRPEWIRAAQGDPPFSTGPGAVETLMALWLEKKETMERAFFESKIPVR